MIRMISCMNFLFLLIGGWYYPEMCIYRLFVLSLGLTGLMKERV